VQLLTLCTDFDHPGLYLLGQGEHKEFTFFMGAPSGWHLHFAYSNRMIMAAKGNISLHIETKPVIFCIPKLSGFVIGEGRRWNV
jgi:hypothetical protein